nr:alpha-amylase 3, chloroplastic isoform X2 [Ipomoea trifida]
MVTSLPWFTGEAKFRVSNFVVGRGGGGDRGGDAEFPVSSTAASSSELGAFSVFCKLHAEDALGWRCEVELLQLQALAVRASSTVIETSDVVFEETFDLKRPHRVEGRIAIRFDSGRDEENWKLTIGEWDQPPLEMRPQGSITIKDYAIETPLKRLSTALEGESFYEVEIDININSQIAAINFVLKDEETGAWYQHRGMDFKVPLMDYAHDDSNMEKRASEYGQGRLGSCLTCSLNLKSIILKVKVEAMA